MSILVSTLLEKMGEIPPPTEQDLKRYIFRESEIPAFLRTSRRSTETEDEVREKAIQEYRKSFRIEYWQGLFTIDFPTAYLFHALVEPEDTLHSMIEKLQAQMPDHPAAPIQMPVIPMDRGDALDEVHPSRIPVFGEEFKALRRCVDDETRNALVDLISKLRAIDA